MEIRQGHVKCFYRMIIAGVITSGDFDHYPSEKEMKEEVAKYFPTFHIDGDAVNWVVNKIHYLED